MSNLKNAFGADPEKRCLKTPIQTNVNIQYQREYTDKAKVLKIA